MGVIHLIETIYSNENGDSDKTSKAQPALKMPKNIRQIGKINTTKKIYVEDYVMSFIKQLVGDEYAICNIAVLVGQCIKADNCRNIFISGAIIVNDADVAGEIVFTNETWSKIYEDIKKYFIEAEIVGWFIGGPGYLLSEEDKILKTHIDNFAGQDKVLLTYDNLEKEESFLSFENNHLSKQEGYYIYYEKNEEMQSYIIDHKKEGSCEADYEDKVSKDIRTVIQNKKTEEEENKSVTKLMYAAGTLLAVIVLIIGAAMLRNYDQMKNMQSTLNYLSKDMEKVQAIFSENDSNNITSDGIEGQADVTKAAEGDATDPEGETTDTKGEKEDGLDVGVVPGNVDPIEEDTSQNADQEDKSNDGTVSDKELAGENKDSDAASAEDTNKSDDTAKASDADKTAESDKTKDTVKSDDSKKATVSDKAEDNKDKETIKSTQKAKTYYTVKDGETLAGISYKLYGTYTKVKKIMSLNGITDQDLIYSGQKIIVP